MIGAERDNGARERCTSGAERDNGAGVHGKVQGNGAASDNGVGVYAEGQGGVRGRAR